MWDPFFGGREVYVPIVSLSREGDHAVVEGVGDKRADI